MFYVTHYDKTATSGPEEGGWYSEGWIIDWSEPCETEEDAIKLLGDYYKEVYNTDKVPEDLNSSFEENDELYIIEDDSNRGDLHYQPLSWAEAESGDYDEPEKPVFDADGRAHFPKAEKQREENEKTWKLLRKIDGFEAFKYNEDHPEDKDAPVSIFVGDVNRKQEKPVMFGFLFDTDDSENEKRSKAWVDNFFKQNKLNYSISDIIDIKPSSSNEGKYFYGIQTAVPIEPENFEESINKMNEDFYDPQQHNDLREEVKDTIRELILNNVEDNLEQVLGSKVKGYFDFYPNYSFGNHEKDSIDAAREKYISVLTNAALNTHFTESLNKNSKRKTIKESNNDESIIDWVSQCLADLLSDDFKFNMEFFDENSDADNIYWEICDKLAELYKLYNNYKGKTNESIKNSKSDDSFIVCEKCLSTMECKKTSKKIPESKLYNSKYGNKKLGICEWCGNEVVENKLRNVLDDKNFVTEAPDENGFMTDDEIDQYKKERDAASSGKSKKKEKLFYCQLRVPYKSNGLMSSYNSNYDGFCNNDKYFKWLDDWKKGRFLGELGGYVSCVSDREDAEKLPKDEWLKQFKEYYGMEKPSKFFTFVPAVPDGVKTASIFFEKSDAPGTLTLADIKRDLKRAGFTVNSTKPGTYSLQYSRDLNKYVEIIVIINDDSDIDKLNGFIKAKVAVADIGFQRPGRHNSCSDKKELTPEMLDN